MLFRSDLAVVARREVVARQEEVGEGDQARRADTGREKGGSAPVVRCLCAHSATAEQTSGDFDKQHRPRERRTCLDDVAEPLESSLTKLRLDQ